MQDLIDVDEIGIFFFVETTNRSSGKAYFGDSVNEKGPYSKLEN